MLRPLSAQFVLLKLDTNDRTEWPKWQRQYPTGGSGVPIVYVVRADGKKLFARRGVPRVLGGFMKQHLANAGTILGGRRLAMMSRVAVQVRGALKRRKIDLAISLFSKHLGTGSLAAAAIHLEKVAKSLSDEATEALKTAQKKLDAKEGRFDFIGCLIF
ncbi:MAG: hypothetical protein IID45_13570 [Planctomycetes bacterium]|nr:hypothetical protein [Planctomycetota bacterium]